MTRETRAKALLAAGSVVLALGGCTQSGALQVANTSIQPLDTAVPDTDVPTDTDEAVCAYCPDTDVPSEPDCTSVDMFPCCDERAAWCETQFTIDDPAYSECLFGPGFDGSTGCIPWGPPAPPRFGAYV